MLEIRWLDGQMSTLVAGTSEHLVAHRTSSKRHVRGARVQEYQLIEVRDRDSRKKQRAEAMPKAEQDSELPLHTL